MENFLNIKLNIMPRPHAPLKYLSISKKLFYFYLFLLNFKFDAYFHITFFFAYCRSWKNETQKEKKIIIRRINISYQQYFSICIINI